MLNEIDSNKQRIILDKLKETYPNLIAKKDFYQLQNLFENEHDFIIHLLDLKYRGLINFTLTATNKGNHCDRLTLSYVLK
ncbi:hypothetical protein SP99_04566 [Enterobacter sp. BIDMC92]|uniref:hypothetical protein n=1 Tax=Enterobacter sp. BIDMC92 TaxID=1594172 RepID=UPI00064D2CFE|nr:hypothetical protein [Enterobacter sp. BIDMC92]KLW85404.1 hypothetical protein SP99_04566 [Enterobacter sp. BIDMC92]